MPKAASAERRRNHHQNKAKNGSEFKNKEKKE